MRSALVVGVLVLAGCRPAPEARDDAARGPADAPPPPQATAAERALLERLAHAERTVESSGWKTFVHGPPGASRETRLRIERFADGRTRIAWEGTGDPPERRWETKVRAPWASRTDLVLRNYAVEADAEPGPTVAWRATQRVRFLPRRAKRPSVELLADAETGLALAETYRDAEGAVFFGSRYEAIEMGPPAETSEDAPPGTVAETLPNGNGAPSAPGTWTPLRLAAVPEGFETVAAEWTSKGSWREDLTDGVAVLTVLQRPSREDAREADPGGGGAGAPVAEGECRRRAWLGGSSLRAVLGGIGVRISGNLPAEVLESVLSGLEPGSGPRR